MRPAANPCPLLGQNENLLMAPFTRKGSLVRIQYRPFTDNFPELSGKLFVDIDAIQGSPTFWPVCWLTSSIRATLQADPSLIHGWDLITPTTPGLPPSQPLMRPGCAESAGRWRSPLALAGPANSAMERPRPTPSGRAAQRPLRRCTRTMRHQSRPRHRPTPAASCIWILTDMSKD